MNTFMDFELQVNPLAETDDGKLIAADAKLSFDDNAAFRQKDIFSMRDASQEDPRWVTVYPAFSWLGSLQWFRFGAAADLRFTHWATGATQSPAY